MNDRSAADVGDTPAPDGASATSAAGTPITGQDGVRERVVQAALMVVP